MIGGMGMFLRRNQVKAKIGSATFESNLAVSIGNKDKTLVQGLTG